MGIHGFAASGPADAAGQPGAALTLAAKAEILDLHEQRRGEAVIELQKINIVGREPRLGVCGTTRLHCGRRRQVFGLADVFVGVPLAVTQQGDGLMGSIFCTVFAGDHHRRSAIGDQRAIQNFERVGDCTGVHYVFDRDEVAHLRFGVLAGPGPARHSGLGKLGLGGAELVHVRAGDQRVISRDSRSIGLFVVGVTRARLHQHRLIAGHEAAQAICHCHDDRVCHACLNGGRCHVERHESGTAAGIDGDTVSRLPADVLGDRLGVIHDGFGEGVACDQPVDLSEGEPGILDGI